MRGNPAVGPLSLSILRQTGGQGACSRHRRSTVMNWSIPIGCVKGTMIRIHATFLLLLLWIGAAHFAQGGWAAAIRGLVFTTLLFLCILLHEFGHVLAARRYGGRTTDITLLPIGGMANLELVPENPAQEMAVALAGPAVSLLISAFLFVLLGGFRPVQDLEFQNPGVDLLARLASANLALGLFNLLPAFPMDGGRVLRAALARRLGHSRGTRIAAAVGQAVAVALALLGLFGNPLLILVALFVYLGAAAEAEDAIIQDAVRGHPVSDGMIIHFESLSPGSALEDAAQCLMHTAQRAFPVVDGAGRLTGVLTRDDMIRALRERGSGTPVVAVMRSDIPVLDRCQALGEALQLMRGKHLPAVGVRDDQGALVGLVTPDTVGDMVMVQAARAKHV
ncbi:stage IV sporulation protein FB [Azospirillum agricola]|uniref:site-2 protease family protein n=1 Tax=Azospirillum agricola TaxID=1720247 RepID=UPI001F2A57A4|nr:site-2 protease family protein [Azospirillum agricola]MBP2233246.1 stage IV sporulation protein FB [Azospirillum agricola]